MVPFIHSSWYTLTIKIKNITFRFPVNVPSPEENLTGQGFQIISNV